LSTRELEIKAIYEEIREKNDSSLLIKYLQEGKIKSTEKDGIGMCPLIFAVDCCFDLDTIKTLVQLGCDPYTIDDNGDTLLHYAVSLENQEVE
jgi:ankyrin repeat protein